MNFLQVYYTTWHCKYRTLITSDVGNRSSVSDWFCQLHNIVNTEGRKPLFNCSIAHLDATYLQDCGGCSVSSTTTSVPISITTPSAIATKDSNDEEDIDVDRNTGNISPKDTLFVPVPRRTGTVNQQGKCGNWLETNTMKHAWIQGNDDNVTLLTGIDYSGV